MAIPGTVNPEPQISETGASRVTRRLRRGGAWIFLGRSLGMGTVMAITIVLAKWLPEKDFANYVVTISLVTLTSVFAMCGLNNLMCRVVAAFFAAGNSKAAKDSFFRIALLAAVITTISVAVFAVASYGLFEILGAQELRQYVWLFVTWILLLSMSQVIAEAFRGLHNLFAASLLAGISGGLLANAIFFASIVVMHFNGVLNYQNVVLAAVGSFLFPILIGPVWLFVTWPKTEETTKHSSESAAQLPDHSVNGLLREAFPIMLMNISAYGFDLSGHLITKGSGSDLQVSTYEAIWKLGFLVVIPLTMLGLASASTIAEQYSVKNKELLQKVIRSVSTICFLVSLPVYLMLVFFAGPIISTVFQESFTIGATGLIIIASAQMIRNWTGPCGVALLMTGHQRWAFACFCLAAPLLLLGPWAVSNYGMIGITSVVAAAFLTARIGHYLVVRWKLGVVPHANLAPRFLSELFTLATSLSLSSLTKKTVPEKARSGNPS